MKNSPVLHRLEYALVRSAQGLLRALPHRAARALGSRLGDLAWAAAGSRRRVALENLAGAFPELPVAARRRLGRESFRQLGAAACDALSAERFDLAGLCRRLAWEGWEHLEEVHGRRGGFVVLSAHLGCWEIAAHLAGAYFGPMHVVGRPLDNPWLDRRLEAYRGRFGNLTLPRRGAARGILRALAADGMVGILIDQRAKPHEAIRVPFFGRPCLTSPVLARIALRHGTPVVPIFCLPEPRGRYRFVARPAIEPEGGGEPAGAGQGEAAVAALTSRYLEACEREIRQRPGQWMWMHERWRGC